MYSAHYVITKDKYSVYSCQSSFFLYILFTPPSFFFHFLPPFSPQVRVSISAVCRGDLSISLESPGGTTSLLLDPRPNDDSTSGLNNWTLMTVHCWGEQPQGLWSLHVSLISSLTTLTVTIVLFVRTLARC